MKQMTISSTARSRINARTEIVMRVIIGKNVIDRVFTPVLTVRKLNGHDITYSQVKKVYEYDGALTGLTVFKLEPSKLRLINTKQMNATSTVNANIEHIIFTLERSGYVVL